MPHGDGSDLAALTMLAVGFQHIFAPAFSLSELVPSLELTKEFDKMTPELEMMMKFTGGLFLILGCMLFTVRWNTINGKLSGFAMIGTGAHIAHLCFNVLDQGKFVLRQWYLIAGVLAFGGFCLMFLANPMPKLAKDKDA